MKVHINPEILVWARQTAGLSADEAASKLSLSTSAKSSAEDKLLALESGQAQPTRNQLSSFANVYKRPLLTFYLAEPPKIGKRGQDFRQSPDTRSARDNGMLDALLRNVKARQEMVRDIIRDDVDVKPLDFVGRSQMKDGVAALVQSISSKLVFDYTDIRLRKGDATLLFKRLRKASEDIGVFVLVLGDLGSHHSTIASSVFRGFAIADNIAPFVVLNAKDARPARAFTLIHELAHVWLGQSGVSGSMSIAVPTTVSARIEQFCNDVAGEFLLPDQHFRNGIPQFDKSDLETARTFVDRIAEQWSVSEPMVAYRLQRRGEISAGVYEALRREYHIRWQAKLKQDAEASTNENGPNPNIMRQFYLGNALVDIVYRNVREKAITQSKAATLLGSKLGAVEPFLQHFETKRTKRIFGAGS